MQAEFFKHNFLAHTEAVIQLCDTCHRPYRTYVPDSICTLPDGLQVTYREPQTQCPVCDENSFGEFMNTDLFPELLNA